MSREIVLRTYGQVGGVGIFFSSPPLLSAVQYLVAVATCRWVTEFLRADVIDASRVAVGCLRFCDTAPGGTKKGGGSYCFPAPDYLPTYLYLLTTTLPTVPLGGSSHDTCISVSLLNV